MEGEDRRGGGNEFGRVDEEGITSGKRGERDVE